MTASTKFVQQFLTDWSEKLVENLVSAYPGLDNEEVSKVIAAASKEGLERLKPKREKKVISDGEKCMARVWGGGVPSQCSKAACDGSSFCMSHGKKAAIDLSYSCVVCENPWGLTHGRIDQDIPIVDNSGRIVLPWKEGVAADTIREKLESGEFKCPDFWKYRNKAIAEIVRRLGKDIGDGHIQLFTEKMSEYDPSEVKKRGRPSGSKNKPKNDDDDSDSDYTKKKRGRPAGSKNKPKNGDEDLDDATKKKRGRPSGSKNKPKNSVDESDSDVPKKKRGRPAGSKNKPKNGDEDTGSKHSRPVIDSESDSDDDPDLVEMKYEGEIYLVDPLKNIIYNDAGYKIGKWCSDAPIID